MSNGRILIVEPDDSVSNLLENWLVKKGYSVKRVDSVDAGMDIARNDKPDVLLLSFKYAQSPTISRFCTNIPILYLTDNVRDIWDSLRTGDDYETHPYDLDSVYLKLARIMKKSLDKPRV